MEQLENIRTEFSHFPTDLDAVLERIRAIDPERYARTRNFKDGAVTRLSPYISRGFISTAQVFEHVKSLGLPWHKVEKLVQELAWRDYWQETWREKGSDINSDLRHPQRDVRNYEIPRAVIEANTGIEAVDEGIRNLYESGYVHNHMRMYIGAIACNNGGSHWYQPAKWMYYHLLDADWASNALSWQWVAGSNSNRKYLANQENINKYFDSDQKDSFLDRSYESLAASLTPDQLKTTGLPILNAVLPNFSKAEAIPGRRTLLYNFYNLDPLWHRDEDFQRILLLEPSIFEQYPVSPRSIEFVLALAKNIQNIQVYVGSFESLKNELGQAEIRYKEHPLNSHYTGIEEERDWMFSSKGYQRSFFAFWKKCRKEIIDWN